MQNQQQLSQRKNVLMKKNHDNIIEDNANFSDEDESVGSSKLGESAECHNTTI